jgi:hypothetical protein
VGIRWYAENTDGTPHMFRVFNVNYPMYGKSEFVSDWVSVGKGIGS